MSNHDLPPFDRAAAAEALRPGADRAELRAALRGALSRLDVLKGALAEVSAEALRLRGQLEAYGAELLHAQGALEDYGTHDEGCEWRPHHDAELDCTCGLVDAKERARKAVKL